MAIDDNTSYELTGYQVKDLAGRIRRKADASAIPTSISDLGQVTVDDVDWPTIVEELYDGGAIGTDGDVPLNLPSSYFIRIRIFYRSSDGNFGSVDVYHPEGKYVIINSSNMNSSGGWIKIKRLFCAADRLTVDPTNSGEILLPSGRNIGNSFIYITRVEGWNI